MEPAVRLLKGLAGDQNARNDLAAVYRRAGYNGAAQFFENTVREINRKDLVLTPATDVGGWGGGERELDEGPENVARRTADLISNGQYREAVRVVQSEIEANGPTLQLSVEWAHAALSLAREAPADVTPEAREVAIRLFLTSIEERVPSPIEVGTKANGYIFLAQSFFIFGDRISARTAARLALSDLSNQAPSPRRASSEQRLRRLIQLTQ